MRRIKATVGKEKWRRKVKLGLFVKIGNQVKLRRNHPIQQLMEVLKMRRRCRKKTMLTLLLLKLKVQSWRRKAGFALGLELRWRCTGEESRRNRFGNNFSNS